MAHCLFLLLYIRLCLVQTPETPTVPYHIASAYVLSVALEQLRKVWLKNLLIYFIINFFIRENGKRILTAEITLQILIADARSPMRQLYVYLRSFWNSFTLAAVGLYCLGIQKKYK